MPPRRKAKRQTRFRPGPWVALGVLLGAILGVGFNGIAWFDRTILATLPADLSQYRAWRPLTTCRVYDAQNNPLDEFYVERRVWVDLEELPDHVWKSFIVAEDRRFFEHPGFDIAGIGRAMLVNLRSGSTSQGASTLTQQLVKNLIVGKERSYTRKLREAALAVRLEQDLDKRTILELYLNFVALGAGNYGVEAASLAYFGVSARDLDPGQAALLAGLVPAPSRYSPRHDPETAAQRRRLVLQGMVQEGHLRAEEAAIYLDDPVIIPRDAPSRPDDSLAYITQVRREVRRLFGEDAPFEEGLQVRVAMDPAVQRIAYEAIRSALEAHSQRQGLLRRIQHTADPEGFLARAAGLDRENTVSAPLPDQCFPVLVGANRDLDALRAGPFAFRLRPEDRHVKVAASEGAPASLSSKIQFGSVLPVCLLKDDLVALSAKPWSEGGAVVLENRTGRVVALVGGMALSLEGFVRATQARRQPGSSFKPYVYAAALMAGYGPLDKVLDGPISMPGGGRAWSPKNYSGGYAGPMTLRRALATSTNTVAVRLILQTGSARVSELAAKMGVLTPIRRDPTIALGSSEVTPMDQALGFATIARGGVRGDPVYIDQITDIRGAVTRAGETVSLDGTAITLPGPPQARALPPGVAYTLTDMMRQVVRAGTARRAYEVGLDRAGKTGTTNGFLDAWFVGFTPEHTIAVWIGTDGTAALGESETGGKTALPAWLAIARALQPEAHARFPVPPEAIFVRAEGEWVAMARGTVPEEVLPHFFPTPGLPLPPFTAHTVAMDAP